MNFTVQLVVECLQGELSDMEDIKADIRETIVNKSLYVDDVKLIEIKVCQ